MKHFLVTDDQGNPIYVDPYFKEKSLMLCLPFGTTQDIMMENFQQRFTSIRCFDNTLFVFTHYNDVLYMVVSDEGESVPFLRRQLQLIHELLQFHFGPKVEKTMKMQQHRVSIEATNALRPLVNTMIDLGSTQQSYLVQSIERLEVNEEIREKCIKALEDALNTHKGHGATHVLLFVGTKLASHFARPKAFELIPPDIFLITLWIKSLQDPSPPPPPPTPTYFEHTKQPTEEEFVLAKEDLTPESDSIMSMRSSSSESIHSQTQPEPFYPPRDLPRLTQDQNIFETIYLRTPNLTPYNIYCGQVAEMTTMVVISEQSAGNKKDIMQEMQNSIRRSLDSFIDFLIIKEKTHVTMLPFLSHFAGLVHFIYVDRMNHQVVAPMVVSLHPEKEDADKTNNDEEQLEKTRLMAEPLKKKVWEMVACAQDRLSQGYTSLTMKVGDFQYSYTLWFEDSDGNGLTIDQPIPFPDTSYDGNFYRETSRRLFPTVRQVNCYELYTLHLAIVPQKQVVNLNQKLIKKLTPRNRLDSKIFFL